MRLAVMDFFLSAKTEGTSMKLLEGMICGAWPLARWVSENRDLASPWQTGLLPGASNIKSFAIVLHQLNADRTLSAQHSGESAKKFVRTLSPKRVIGCYECLCDSDKGMLGL